MCHYCYERKRRLVFRIATNSMLSTERRRKCDVSVSTFFFRPPRKANYTRAVTTRGDYVEARSEECGGNWQLFK